MQRPRLEPLHKTKLALRFIGIIIILIALPSCSDNNSIYADRPKIKSGFSIINYIIDKPLSSSHGCNNLELTDCVVIYKGNTLTTDYALIAPSNAIKEKVIEEKNILLLIFSNDPSSFQSFNELNIGDIITAIGQNSKIDPRNKPPYLETKKILITGKVDLNNHTILQTLADTKKSIEQEKLKNILRLLDNLPATTQNQSTELK